MPVLRSFVLALVGAVCQFATVCAVQAQSQKPAPERSFSAEELQARQKVLDSESWRDARQKLDKWLSVQVAYDPAELDAIKKSFASRIDRSTADDLTILLHTMQRRLDVLLSPDVVAAREWADSLYTEKGKSDLMEKRGLADPMAMSAKEITAALAQFATDRQSQANSTVAFAQQQASAVAGANESRKRQEAAAAAAAAAARKSATFAPSYAPKRQDRPQRYEAPYNPVRYSIGPWGGAWVGH